MIGKLSPSMMCVPPAELERYVRIFEEEGAEYLHIDVMDGVFVPNFALGTDFCRHLRAMTRIPLDLHLMIRDPEYKLDWFDIQPGERVSVHVESTPHIHRALARIRAFGAEAAAALNPGTPVGAVAELLPDLDAVLVMAVDPGFCGQKIIPQTFGKVGRLRRMLDAQGASGIGIEVDGNVSFDTAARLRAAGADVFVAGTSGLFDPPRTTQEALARLRTAIAAPAGKE